MLALPVFALNGLGFRGEPPDILWRVLGAACTAAFVYFATALFVRLRGPAGMGWGDASATNLVAFGMSDITPVRPHA